MPWRDSGCDYRKQHFIFLKKYYSQIGNIIPVDSTKKYFNRANARNECVKIAKDETFLIIDADNFIEISQILQGFDLAKNTNKIVRPFNSIHYLNDDATKRFYKNKKNFILKREDYEYMYPEQICIENSGGAYIVIKKQWENLNGMNESFTGWGGEDLEFNLRYIKKYGKQETVPGKNYNLYHPNDRIMSENNKNLMYKLIRGTA